MAMLNLPAAPDLSEFQARDFNYRPPREALSRWNPNIRAEGEQDSETTITIFDVIGRDPWTGEGVTLKRIDAALRSIGPRDVTVNINSPGGSVFEGFGIYERFRQHSGNVTMNVLALAGSAASVIAMAGNKINIAPSAFFFVHNSWGLVIGNRHDLRRAIKDFEQFDGSMRAIYEKRTGQGRSELEELMDDESFLNAEQSIELGFADGELEAAVVESEPTEDQKAILAVREVENRLRETGCSANQARRLISEMKGARDATPNVVTRDADDTETVAGLIGFRDFLNNLSK